MTGQHPLVGQEFLAPDVNLVRLIARSTLMFLANFRGWMAGKEAAAHAIRINRLIDGGPWAQSDVDQSIIFWAQGWQMMFNLGLIQPLPHIPNPSSLFDLMLCFLVNELGRSTAHMPRFAALPIDRLWVEFAAGVILSRTHSERDVINAMKTREFRRTALLHEERISRF